MHISGRSEQDPEGTSRDSGGNTASTIGAPFQSKFKGSLASWSRTAPSAEAQKLGSAWEAEGGGGLAREEKIRGALGPSGVRVGRAQGTGPPQTAFQEGPLLKGWIWSLGSMSL